MPRGPAAPRRRGERRPAISFISERQLTYTDWLPAAKCQLNCKCLAEAGREGRLPPEGAACVLAVFAPRSDAVEFISPCISRSKILMPSWKAFALASFRAKGAPPGEQGGRGGSSLVEGLYQQGGRHSGNPENSSKTLAYEPWCGPQRIPLLSAQAWLSFLAQGPEEMAAGVLRLVCGGNKLWQNH